MCRGLDVYSLTFSYHPSYIEKGGRHNNDPLTMFTSQSSEHVSTLLHRCSKLRTLKGEFSWIMWVGPV